MNIEISHPNWYILLCLLLGVVYGFLFYRKEKLFKDIALWQLFGMTTLRTLVVAILAFLLLEPLVTVNVEEVEKPFVIYLQDESESILLSNDSTYLKSNWFKDLSTQLTAIEDKYELKKYAFGANIHDSLKNNFVRKQTNISVAIEEVYNRFDGRNIGAVILASDGIYNQGANPIYSIERLSYVPFYTIALGDTTERKDLAITQIVNNDLAYKGNDFPVQVIIKAKDVENSNTKVQVYRGDKLVHEKQVDVNSNQVIYPIDFVLNAKNEGRQKYTVKVTQVDSEITYENNTNSFYIDVIENRQQILLLAKSPHPDLGAIKNSILKNKNYNLTIQYANDFDGNFKPYNLVIFHQLPDGGNSFAKKALAENKPSWFIFGNQTSVAQFNQLNTGVKLIGPKGSTDVTAKLNQDFVQFSVDNLDNKSIPKYPPLTIPMAAEYKFPANANHLLFQKVGNTITNFPLFSFIEKDDLKLGVLMGEGIWRWRINAYLINNNFDSFDQLIVKTIQYLSAKEDKKRFKVFTKATFSENEEVVFSAELLNEAFELVNSSEVELELSSNDFTYPEKVFSKVGNSYRLNLGQLPPGEYTYKANTTLGKESFTEQGQFLVKEIKVEYSNLQANHHLLYQLSNSTNGKLYYPNEISQLASDIIKSKNIVDVVYSSQKTEDLIRYKWVFYLLLTLLTLEWVSRKRLGAY